MQKVAKESERELGRRDEGKINGDMNGVFLKHETTMVQRKVIVERPSNTEMSWASCFLPMFFRKVPITKEEIKRVVVEKDKFKIVGRDQNQGPQS